ncbi:DUF6082 family protein [Streptomyces sp. NPDC057253]|uniref:DUF6082 family protein n=1 Tax=Streptomyces sp. NPDC057253 TaxID=3346069 RepID=UPI00363E7510
MSQTYAAISVPLSAIALLGAIASLGYQARQAHISHIEASRATQQGLLLRAFDDPSLLVCWGPHPHPITQERWRQFVYVNMILSFWYTEHRLRSSNEILPLLAIRLFRGDIGREYWATWGASWKDIGATGGRKGKSFLEIMDRAFQEAEAEGPPLPSSQFFCVDAADPE